MSNVVLFKLQDDDSVWLADLDAGTVEQVASDLIDGEESSRGIDFAYAVQARSEAASHQFFPSRSQREEPGIEFAIAAGARSGAASHQFFPSR